MVEKVIDVKTKTNLQSPFGIRKIDFKCPKRYKLLVKKDKNDIYWKHHNKIFNKDKKEAKFITLTPLPLINLRLKPLRSVKKVSKEAI